MVHTKEEIINALQIIKNECSNSKNEKIYPNKGCKSCPFYSRNGDDCLISYDIPDDWEINIRDHWRGFV